MEEEFLTEEMFNDAIDHIMNTPYKPIGHLDIVEAWMNRVKTQEFFHGLVGIEERVAKIIEEFDVLKIGGE